MKKITGKSFGLEHGAEAHVGMVRYLSIDVKDFAQEGLWNNPYIALTFLDWQGEILMQAPLSSEKADWLISALEKAKVEIKKHPLLLRGEDG